MTDAPSDGSFGPNGPPASYSANIMAATAVANAKNARDVDAYKRALQTLTNANFLLKRLGLGEVPQPKPTNMEIWYAYAGEGARASEQAELQAEGRLRYELEAYLAEVMAMPEGPQRDAALNITSPNWSKMLPGGERYVPGYAHIDAYVPKLNPALTVVTPSGWAVVNGIPYNPNSKIPLPDVNNPVAVAAYKAAREIEDLVLSQGGTPTEARVAAGDEAGKAAASADVQQKVMIGGGSAFVLVALWIFFNRRRS